MIFHFFQVNLNILRLYQSKTNKQNKKYKKYCIFKVINFAFKIKKKKIATILQILVFSFFKYISVGDERYF